MTKATGPRFEVHFRRRRKVMTDYASRLALLKSGKPRLVVRKTNRYIIAHIANSGDKGDLTVTSATSKQLAQYGFAGKCNAPSAYLTGFLVAKRAIAAGVTEANLDIGLHTSTQGSIVFVALKGAVDAGLKSNLDEAKLPDESRINGSHLKLEAAFEKAKQAIAQNPSAKPKTVRAKKVEKK